MPITNDDELKEAATIASGKLQEIQEYLGRRDSNPGGRVDFPRGYLRDAETFRKDFPYLEYRQKSNIAYARMLNDVYWWILHRTDLSSIAKDMVVKAALYNLGAIAEALTALYSRQHDIGKKHGFDARCKRMATATIITEDCRDELQWLWRVRSNIHMHELKETDYNRGYRIEEYDRASAVLLRLKEELLEHSKAL